MGNQELNSPEALAIFDTRHRTKANKTNNTQPKSKKISKTDPTKTIRVNQGASEGKISNSSFL